MVRASGGFSTGENSRDTVSSPASSSNASEVLSSDKVFSCSRCGLHLVDYGDIISRAFHGRSGRAFLFDHVRNISVGQAENRHLMTGLHTVADIQCKGCGSTLGWKYEQAHEQSQKYKEGKFILEKARLVKNW